MTATVSNQPFSPQQAQASSSQSKGRAQRKRLGPRFSIRGSVKKLKIGAASIAIIAVLTYGVGGSLVHEVDNNASFTVENVPAGASTSVAVAAALIDREINEHGWTPNDPWFAPTAFLDNMPNFQAGMMRSIGRFSFELLDQVARRRATSASDGDLERATGLLQFPPDVWVFDLDQSFLPTVPSETQYREGMRALLSYNERLAAGDAVFERRADTLAGSLTRISADLGSLSAQLESAKQTGWWIFSTKADDVFYVNKGMMYGYYTLLSAFGKDFENVIRERNLEAVWEQTLNSLRQGASLQPTIVLNADIERSVFANHLALQGFYLKRAMLQLDEVVNVLAI